MPSRSNISKFVKRAILSMKDPHPTTATVVKVDGNLADIRLEGHSTNITNCRITGDPRGIKVGMLVSIVWEDYNGTLRPSIVGGSSGVNLSAYNGSIMVDNSTIENSQYGLRVKMGGITEAHLSFDINSTTSIDDILPNWTVTPEGILYSGNLAINPSGSITLGQDPDIVKLSTEDGTYRIWAGDLDPASAPFSVSKTGHLISSSGDIGGWNIGASTIYDDSNIIVLDSANKKITVDTNKVILNSSGITAIAGVIAGWTINSTQIKKNGIILDSANDRILVGSASPNIIIDGPAKLIKSSDHDLGVSGFGIYATDGFAEFNNVRVRGSLHASVFSYGDIQATAGTLLVSHSAGKLENDFTSPASLGSNVNIDVTNDTAGNPTFSFYEGLVNGYTILSGGSGYVVGDVLTLVKSPGSGATVEVLEVSATTITKVRLLTRGVNYTTGTATTSGGTGASCTITITSVKDEGDILRIKALQSTGVSQSWFEVQGKTDNGSWSRYDCELKYGDTSTTYRKGTGVADIGQRKSGLIYLSADGTVGNSANISFVEWERSVPSSLTKVAGGSNYTVGDRLWIDDNSSLAPREIRVTSVSFGAVTGFTDLGGGSEYSVGTHATYPVQYYGGTKPSGCTISVNSITEPWSGSEVLYGRLGDMGGSYGAPYDDRYGFGFGSYASGNYISYNAETQDGFVLSAVDGGVKIDSTGVSILSGTTSVFAEPNALRWINSSGTNLAHLYTYEASNDRRFWITLDEIANKDAYIGMIATAPTGYTAQVKFVAYEHGPSYINTLYVEPRRVKIDQGVMVGNNSSIPGAGMIGYTGNLKSYKNSTSYNAYAYVPLTTPLTSTSWDGDAKSDSSGSIDLSVVFGVPAGVKAINVQIFARDSAAWGTSGLAMSLGPLSGTYYGVTCRPAGGDVWAESNGIVNCTSGGDVYYNINASGASTLDVYIRIWGYWI